MKRLCTALAFAALLTFSPGFGHSADGKGKDKRGASKGPQTLSPTDRPGQFNKGAFNQKNYHPHPRKGSGSKDQGASKGTKTSTPSSKKKSSST